MVLGRARSKEIPTLKSFHCALTTLQTMLMDCLSIEEEFNDDIIGYDITHSLEFDEAYEFFVPCI